MDWQMAAVIVLPLGGGIGWIINKLDKRFDRLASDIKEVRTELNSVGQRVARIEGQLMGHPEPKLKEKS